MDQFTGHISPTKYSQLVYLRTFYPTVHEFSRRLTSTFYLSPDLLIRKPKDPKPWREIPLLVQRREERPTRLHDEWRDPQPLKEIVYEVLVTSPSKETHDLLRDSHLSLLGGSDHCRLKYFRKVRRGHHEPFRSPVLRLCVSLLDVQ